MTAAVAGQPVTALPGSRIPLGATVSGSGTNFAVASGVADGMVLCLFDEGGARAVAQPDDDRLRATPAEGQAQPHGEEDREAEYPEQDARLAHGLAHAREREVIERASHRAAISP